MREQVSLAIMFADIAGSTKLYEKLGDAKARQITSSCIAELSQITKENQGRVIKTIGDEVMCTFPSADLAAEAAVRMQEEVERESPSWGTQLSIRIGFHFGGCIAENGDVFGDAVNLAARMAGQAKGGQIITTGETLDEITSAIKGNSRLIITTTVKGKEKPIQIYEITWGEEEDLTIMGGMQRVAPAQPVAKLALRVWCQDKKLIVGEALPTITMGRGTHNHLPIPDVMASRTHARIEFKRDKFVLIDQSTNGTYVFNKAGKRFLHCDELVLEGRGIIGLGKEVTEQTPEAVHFSPD